MATGDEAVLYTLCLHLRRTCEPRIGPNSVVAKAFKKNLQNYNRSCTTVELAFESNVLHLPL